MIHPRKILFVFGSLIGALNALKCYGNYFETTKNKTKIDGFCVTEYGEKTVKDKGGPCKVLDCDALSTKRLRLLRAKVESKPTSCFMHSIKRFDGGFSRIHSCGPDKHDIIPYSLLLASFDVKTGLDNGFLRKSLKEECRAYEIKRVNAGKTRICAGKGGKCAATYVSPGDKFDKIDNLIMSGAKLCPGRGVCETVEVSKRKTCRCSPAYKACRLIIPKSPDEPRRCEVKIVKKTELTPHDAICDFVEKMSCKPLNSSGVCECNKARTFGIGPSKLSAECRYINRLKSGVLTEGMKQICRKKVRTTTGTWHPTGNEAEVNSICFCNKGKAPCNEGDRPDIVKSLAFVISVAIFRLFYFNADDI